MTMFCDLVICDLVLFDLVLVTLLCVTLLYMTLFLFDFRWGLIRWGATSDNALWGQRAVSSDQRIRDPQVLRQGRIWRCDKGERDGLYFLLAIYQTMSFSVLTSILSLVISYNSLVSQKGSLYPTSLQSVPKIWKRKEVLHPLHVNLLVFMTGQK